MSQLRFIHLNSSYANTRHWNSVSHSCLGLGGGRGNGSGGGGRGGSRRRSGVGMGVRGGGRGGWGGGEIPAKLLFVGGKSRA